MENFISKVSSPLETFKLLFEHKPEALIIIEQDSLDIVDGNLAALKLFGYNRNELISKKATDLVIHPDITRARIELMKAKQEPFYEVIRNVEKKNGEIIKVEIFLSALPAINLIVASIDDVTEKIKQEAHIKKLKAAVEQSNNIIIITDTEGKIEYVNKKFEETTQFSKNQAIGNKTNILKSGKHTPFFYKHLWETIMEGKVWRNEMINKKKNNELYWEDVTITPVHDVSGILMNFIAIKEDITEKKLAEKKLLEAIIKTEEKERKKLSEDLHDELGPFLSGIKLFINEFKYEDLQKDRKNELVEYLNQLINEAIEKTRTISNNLMPGILADYGIHKALQSFIKKINITNNIQINYHLNCADKRYSSVIETVIYRVIIEFINNSIKHSECSEINIYFDDDKGHLEIMYTDNGKGMDSNNQTSEGMGLNNVINRIKSVNGKFNFINRPGNGLKFIVNLDINNEL